MLVNTVNTLTN